MRIGIGIADVYSWYVWLVDRYPYGGRNIVWWPMKYINGIGVVQEELQIRTAELNVNLYRWRWNGSSWEYDTRTITELMGGPEIEREASNWDW